MKCVTAAALAAIAFSPFALAAPARAQANLVVNGSFAEGPPVTADGNTTIYAGQTSLTGWTISGASVDYNTYYWQEPPNTTASIDLDGTFAANAAGAISQTIPTVVGAVYNGRFYLSGNPTCDGPEKRVLTVVGPVMHEYAYNTAAKGTTLQEMHWTVRRFSFTAVSDLTTLLFASETPGDCGAVITGIYVGLSNSQ